MKIGIVSDSHGDVRVFEDMLSASGAADAEMWLHAGDFAPDADVLEEMTGKPVVRVLGNCDFHMEGVYDETIVEISGHRIFLTHGHLFNVRFDTAMLAAAPSIAVLRDPTRGGVAASLNEIARAAGVGILLEGSAIPVRPEVQGVCDLLGFDPLTLANEGKLIAFVPPADTDAVLAVMHENPYGREACVIGQTTAEAPGEVGLRTALGGIRIVDLPLGELVPRIC